jgi:NADP-dependent alcohol dehydrogenase
MENFEYYNPTRLIFGRGSIARLAEFLPTGQKVLLTYGGGSIMANGVHRQVREALAGYEVLEFGGIEANPEYSTLRKAVQICRQEDVDFLLAVGGGSVLDGTKFIAAARFFDDGDPWRMCVDDVVIERALPLASVLTLPATGSEANAGAVISHRELGQKRPFMSDLVRPKFSILDPETTFTLPTRQTINGIIDAFVHVVEQYVTYDVNTPLQDRQAEAILSTLVEEGPKVLADPRNYDARANIMWCATQALNGLIRCGAISDWGTHMIGHELTALWGLDHAQSLAVVLPGLWRHEKQRKRNKLLQYGERVWGIRDGDENARIEGTIAKTVAFFQSLGVKTNPADYDISEDGYAKVADRLAARGAILGEHDAIGRSEVISILKLCN